MPAITIRHVPDQTRDTLAARAAARGQSLQEYLLGQLVELASRPDPREVLKGVRERKERLRTTLAADAILALRDQDRR